MKLGNPLRTQHEAMMNADEEIWSISKRVRELELGIRVFALATVIVVCYLNLRMALALPAFERLISDMVGNKPLPLLTQLAIGGRPAALMVSALLPVLGIFFACLDRSLLRMLIVLAVIIIVCFVQLTITWSVMFLPLLSVVQSMQQGAP